MSESTIPFEGQTMTQAPTSDVEVGDGGNRTKMLALGGLAAVLVLGLVAYFLLFAGGEEELAGSPAGRSPSSSGAVQEEAPAAAKPAKKQRISAKSFGRDPFKALIVEAAEAPAAASDTSGGAVLTSGATTTGTGSSTTGTTTQPETSVPAPSTAHKFKVVSVAPDNSTVTVKVDGKFYRNLKAGDIFATYFKVRGIGGQQNAFQYGELLFTTNGTKRISIA
jgi:hypothetical protein